MTARRWLLETAIEPRTRTDHRRMMAVFESLSAAGAPFRHQTDIESGQTIIMTEGEADLALVIEALRTEHGVEANVAAPQVAYREVISQPVEVEYIHKKQSGAAHHFARVKLEISPANPALDCAFRDAMPGIGHPADRIAAVGAGVRSAIEAGPLAGYPLIGLEVALVDWTLDDAASPPAAIETAARAAVREGLRKAGTRLWEPVMQVEIVTPAEFVRVIESDLASRRGQITDRTRRGDVTVLSAFVPLAMLLRFPDRLRALSRGSATCTQTFAHYAPVPSRPGPDGPDDFGPAIGMRA